MIYTRRSRESLYGCKGAVNGLSDLGASNWDSGHQGSGDVVRLRPEAVIEVSPADDIRGETQSLSKSMLTLLALHGSGRDETDLLEFCYQLTPQANVIAPRGPFAQSDGFTFFRRRPDRSIAAAEVVELAKKWVLQEAEAHLPSTGQIVLVGYSSGAIFAEALLTVASDRFAGAILMRPEPLSRNFNFSRMSEKPILIIAGKHDEHRRHDDGALLTEQLITSRAVVSLHVIDAGHGWAHDNADVALARSWLNNFATV